MANKSEQRQLLELEADLMRLKITAQHLKMKKANEQHSSLDTILGLTDIIPTHHLLRKSLLLPLGWKNRILAGAAYLLWKMKK